MTDVTDAEIDLLRERHGHGRECDSVVLLRAIDERDGRLRTAAEAHAHMQLLRDDTLIRLRDAEAALETFDLLMAVHGCQERECVTCGEAEVALAALRGKGVEPDDADPGRVPETGKG